MRLLLLCLLVPALALAAPASDDDTATGDGSLESSTDVSTESLTKLPDAPIELQLPGKKVHPPGFGGWFHVGGGAGAMIGARKVHPTIRFDMGFGGYLFLVYGGLGLNITGSQHLDFVLTGVGYAGLAIPIPVVRPLFGFKFGGGLHMDSEWGASPALQMGPQLGVHIGQLGGSGLGLRIMIDPEAIVSLDHRMAGFSIMGSVALLL
jgi:hypothetical protein